MSSKTEVLAAKMDTLSMGGPGRRRGYRRRTPRKPLSRVDVLLVPVQREFYRKMAEHNKAALQLNQDLAALGFQAGRKAVNKLHRKVDELIEAFEDWGDEFKQAQKAKFGGNIPNDTKDELFRRIDKLVDDAIDPYAAVEQRLEGHRARLDDETAKEQQERTSQLHVLSDSSSSSLSNPSPPSLPSSSSSLSSTSSSSSSSSRGVFDLFQNPGNFLR